MVEYLVFLIEVVLLSLIRTFSSVGGGRIQSSSLRIVKSKTLDDGQTWRKYGQKEIQSAKHPRYFSSASCNLFREQKASMRSLMEFDVAGATSGVPTSTIKVAWRTDRRSYQRTIPPIS